jgi:hypothetical protein
VQTSEYSKRVIALFESGKATEAQKAEMVEAVLSNFERDADSLAAIHKAIKFYEAQAADEAELRERYTRTMLALA